MTRIWVDFNARDDAGHFRTLAKFAEGPISVGARVTACDHEGNAADGIVMDSDEAVVVLELDLRTFRTEQYLAESAS